MKNPLTKDKTLGPTAAQRVIELRKIRNNARRAARTGHPGRRAEALRAEATAAVLIRRAYVRDAGRERVR